MQLANIADQPGILPTHGIAFGERSDGGIVDLAATLLTGGPVRAITDRRNLMPAG